MKLKALILVTCLAPLSVFAEQANDLADLNERVTNLEFSPPTVADDMSAALSRLGVSGSIDRAAEQIQDLRIATEKGNAQLEQIGKTASALAEELGKNTKHDYEQDARLVIVESDVKDLEIIEAERRGFWKSFTLAALTLGGSFLVFLWKRGILASGKKLNEVEEESLK